MTAISKSVLRLALVAGALGFAAMPALAQDYGYSGDENITVTAPRFHAEGNPMNPVPDKVSLSMRVRYDDLDLRSRGGAHSLRIRVRDAAQDVCDQLADAYPFYQLNGTSCYKTALQDGMVRADAAIRGARDRRYEDY
ncbi:MAG: UrcA family protein [Rhizomicrobium sp.]